MNKYNNSTAIVRVACAILFCFFSFSYLYFYQGDLLMVAQHVLSKGQTQYVPFVGAFLLTLGLQLLQIGVNSVARLYKSSHAVTYLPSMLLLAILTSIYPDIDKYFSFGIWIWLFPSMMVAYVWVVYMLRQIQEVEKEPKGLLLASPRMWVNLLIMLLLFLMVGFVGNSNDIFHHRMRMERLLTEKNYEQVLTVGEKSSAADSSMTMLRIHALAKTNQLGESLFDYPLVGGVEAMQPNGTSVRTLMYPQKEILLQRKKSAADYQLCEQLLKKDLKAFVALLMKYYPLNKPLPKHYKEALYLYGAITPHAKYKLNDNVMAADYADFKKLRGGHVDKAEEQGAVRESYGKTYWYYFYYNE